MKRPKVFVAATALAALGFAGSAHAQKADKQEEETTLTQADMPRPVMDAVNKKYPGAKLKKFEKELDEGKPVFEIELSAGKNEISVNLSPEGKILAEETIIKASALPAPVKAGLQASKYKGWRITRAEKVVEEEKEDAPLYEVLVQSKKERFEVVMDQNGKITKEEAKSEKDTD